MGIFYQRGAVQAVDGHKGSSSSIVTSIADSGEGSLRQVIADSTPGTTITFSSNLSGGTITLSSTLNLTHNLTINGSSLEIPITLSGNNAVRVIEVYMGTTVNLDSLRITKGSSDFGAGIFTDGTLTIIDSSLSGNNASSEGGGIFNNNNGVLSVINSTLSGNTAGNGGGIANYDDLSITNCTFSGNTAIYEGGGIFNDGTLDITNSTFSKNSAVNGGGILNSYEGILNYSNTIIAYSTSGGDCRVYPWASITGNINNLVENGSDCGTPTLNGDPKLGELTENGGKTKTLALLSGSPAINAADPGLCPDEDQRGVSRPLGGICDIGAYESGAKILTVASTTPSNNSTLSNLSSITVNFSEHALANGTANAANNTANYLLVELGANGSFDTQSCNDGVQGDDIQKAISSVSYSNNSGAGPFTATLTLDSSLADGSYRLFICGTTSIWSAAGLKLNNGLQDEKVDFTIREVNILPNTGFTQGQVTYLTEQEIDSSFTNFDLILDIPVLEVSEPIVGVPRNEDSWDVSWLGSKIGYLEGTAFPTWDGNTVLTGHVWNADNTPGVFANLKTLKYGDQIKIHGWGEVYTYEVRENKQITPTDIDSILKHEEKDWVTLVTCSGYDEESGEYSWRTVVRAVLISVEAEE
ncbi:MAG: sortase [Anaerolineaceae bacterium]